MDKTYVFPGFCLTTYPQKGKDYIQCLWFTDDTVQTQEGIRIGDAAPSVKALLPDAVWNGEDTCSKTAEGGKITIVFKDDSVSAVVYEALFE